MNMKPEQWQQVEQLYHAALERAPVRKMFGRGRWRKRTGSATVRLPDGIEQRAEVHWYEAHGIGKRKLKIKRYLD